MSRFLKVFVLCVATFIFILLVMRLEQIAEFATLGPGALNTLLYTLYQLPYILPLSIPIACLIASLLLFQGLSHNSELVALRASGLSLRQITSPVFTLSAFIVAINFFIISEIATSSHLKARQLQNKFESINPLAAIQNPNLLKFKGLNIAILGSSIPGTLAKDVILAYNNPRKPRLDLLISKRMKLSSKILKMENVTILTSPGEDRKNAFDRILVENIQESLTPIEEFYPLLTSGGWRLSNDHLRASLLAIKIQELRKKYQAVEPENKPKISKDLQGCYSEIARRVSLSLAAFTFTLMGAAFGIQAGRERKKWLTLIPIALTTFFLFGFFGGKANDFSFPLASTLFFSPHIVIAIVSIWALNRTTKGVGV